MPALLTKGLLESLKIIRIGCPDGNDINKKKSTAFVLLCMSTCLEMPMDEAAELITDGGNDAGVDGLHVGEVEDGEFLVTIFQG